MADLSDPLLLQMIAECRISYELAVRHAANISRHQRLQTSFLWLNKRDERAVPERAEGRVNPRDWMQVMPGRSDDPERILAEAVRASIRRRESEDVMLDALAKNVDVRVRRDKAYVYPMTPGGLSWAIEPILVVAVEEAALARAIDEAFDAAPAQAPKAPDFRDPDRPNPLRSAGIKSDWGSKLFSLKFLADVTSISRWSPDRTGNGFVDSEVFATLPCSTSTRELARAIIDALPSTAEK